MKIQEHKLYSYKMDHDNGFAPNPYFGVLTLATCKPKMRYNTKVGNWIAGWTSKQMTDNPTEVGEEKLVYLAKVTQKLTFDKYWEKYPEKRPICTNDPNAPERKHGDNIYQPDNTAKRGFIQIKNNYHHCEEKMVKDLSGKFVLICEEFYYFSSKTPLEVSMKFRPNVPKGQQSYGKITEDASEFINYVKQHAHLCKLTDAK